jgi:polysaccharide export outer membrane protein
MNKTLNRQPKFLLLTLTCITILFIQSSCNSYKKIPYFQDLSRTQITKENINNYTTFTIQPHDQLSISVGSKNPEADAVFGNNQKNAGTNPSNANYGYTVNEKGEVKLPLLGVIKVAGLSTDQLSEQLQKSLAPYLSAPSVTVTVLNFKVAVLGDVLRPNIYNSNSERLTIPEALSLAGDLNITAKREDIVLVREKDGKREYIPIDLTSKEIFKSPYFYLKSNDLIYVTPSKAKLSTVNDKGYQNASLIIGALSVLAIAISLFRN